MKAPCLALILISLLLGATSARAEEAQLPPRYMVSLDVGHLVYSLFPPSTTVIVPFELEAAVHSHVSVFAAPRFAIRGGDVGFGLGLGARFYLLNGPALSGLWLGPEFGILYGVSSPAGTSATLAFSLGAGAGYNFILGHNLVLSPGVNVGVVGLGSSSPVFDFRPRLVVGFAL